jgi:hypothetical protein
MTALLITCESEATAAEWNAPTPALRLAEYDAPTPESQRQAFQRRVEEGLDRLLRDIEDFQEGERWDGME